MNDPHATCTRCGRPLGGSAVSVSVGGAPGDSFPPDVRLCGHCSRSFEHWLRRPSRPAAAAGSGVASATATTARRRRRRKPGWKGVARSVVGYSAVALVIFFILYRILGGLMRPPE